jgi:hypothetical protein
MRRLSVEVNDYEICKRLETLLLTSKEDLPMIQIKALIEKPLDFEPKEIQEPYTQYVRHFIYMVKRNERSGNKHNGYGDDSEFDHPISKKSKSKLASVEIDSVEKKEAPEAPIVKKSIAKPASKKKTTSHHQQTKIKPKKTKPSKS